VSALAACCEEEEWTGKPYGLYSESIWNPVHGHWGRDPDIWLGSIRQRSDDAGVGSKVEKARGETPDVPKGETTNPG
jgi:hypothetical protein